MSKIAKIKVDKDPETATPEVVTPEATPEVVVKDQWPEVGTTGKFNAVPYKDGYVVYNPSGQRATGVVTKVVADDIVREQNRAAQIKG